MKEEEGEVEVEVVVVGSGERRSNRASDDDEFILLFLSSLLLPYLLGPLAEHEKQRIDDVGFARAVGPHDRGEGLLER